MSKLVMIIEDSPTMRKIIETSLKREGFSYISFSDGIEALGTLAARPDIIPDVVVLDIGLPKMDGYEVARRLRTKAQYSKTVVIMCSSRDGIIDKLKGRLVGAKDYITKPFRYQDVISTIYSHLGERVPAYT